MRSRVYLVIVVAYGTAKKYSVLSEPQIGSFGWGGYVEEIRMQMKTMHRSMPLTEHGQHLTGRYNRFGDNDQVALSATGSLVAAAGRIFAANEIGDGYAVVTNAGPQSQIINGGVNLGETDKSGRFLIANLTLHVSSYLPRPIIFTFKVGS